MGSLAVRAFAAEHDDCMDMLIVCGSPSNRRARIAGSMIAKLEGKLFGMRHRSRLLEILSFGNYAARFSGEKNRNAWICSDPEVYQAYTDSDLRIYVYGRCLSGSVSADERAYDVKHWNCTKPELPVLFISGADDPCLGQCAAVCSGSSENERRRLQGCKRETLSGNAP